MKKLWIVLFASICLLPLNAQLVINEFMAGNTSSLQDESGEYVDWIEIYNPGASAVDLKDYYITDNFQNKLKHPFSTSLTLPAGGYLVLFADDDEGDGILHTNFKLSLDGEELAIIHLSGTDTIWVDSLTFPAQTNDISYGRFPDGNTHFEYFTEPTPGSANVSGDVNGIAPLPAFSIPGGFYSGTQTIELGSSLAGVDIRYTTDGSEPGPSSSLYTAAIISDTTLVIKAKVYATNYLPGNSLGNTYFIDEHFMPFDISERLPVVSLSCKEEDLYGSTGILDNAFQDWERMVNFELFEPDGTQSINQYAGVKVYGNATRALEQKSLALFARSSYGKGSFDYKFFDDKPFDKWENIVLRNGGSDWSLTYFRDALCQALVRNNMYIDAQGSKHAILYLNGKFYGIIDLKEKVNEHYVEMNRGADPDNIDMLSDDQTICYGDAQEYTKFRNFLVNSDMSVDPLYKEITRQMDIPSFMNRQITQIYIADIDMFLNSKFWREKENYGIWRWILYDTELSFAQGDYSYTTDYGTTANINTLDFATSPYGGSGWPFLRPWSSEQLASLMNSETFRNEFIQTFAVHINTTFKVARVVEMIDSMQQRIHKEIPEQIATYGGHTIVFNPYGTHFTAVFQWKAYVQLMRDFANDRPDYMRSFIMGQFGLQGMYDLTVTSNDESAGTVSIQDIHIPYDSVGIYFDNIPLKLEAKAKPGYRFVRWEGTNLPDSTSSIIQLNLAENSAVQAIFGPEADLMITEILYKNPDTNIPEYIELLNPKHATALDIGNYSLSSAVNFTFPDSTLIAPMQRIVVASNDSLLSTFGHSTAFSWTSGDLPDDQGDIILKNSSGNTIDSVHYSDQSPWPTAAENSSIALIAPDRDNNIGTNWNEGPNAGTPGIPYIADAINNIKINEFSSNNHDFYADENNQYDDWLELTNLGTETVDLGGTYFTDTLNTKSLYQIPCTDPVSTSIKPGEHKVFWADGDTKQGALHLGFKLNALAGAIGLSADGRTFIDSVSYSQQNENVSTGRYADGTDTWRNFDVPTPGRENNLPPVFTSTPVLTCRAHEPYEYLVTWSDEENDDVILGIMSLSNWLTFSDITGNSALISGTAPGGASNSFNISFYICDGTNSPVYQSFTITKETPQDIPGVNFADGRMVTCYPNPTHGMVYLEGVTDGNHASVVITGIDGKLVMTKELQVNGRIIEDAIDLGSWQKGLYFITVQTEEKSYTFKIVVNM
jgi:hypothetical protein